MPKFSQIWPLETLSSWHLCSFDIYSPFFGHFLTSCPRCSRLILYRTKYVPFQKKLQVLKCSFGFYDKKYMASAETFWSA